MIIISPLEEFEVVSRTGGRIGITNVSVIIIIVRGRGVITKNRRFANGEGNLVPNRYQRVVEEIQRMVLGIRKQSVGEKGEKYGPYIFARFLFILQRNRRGLIPYSYSVMAQGVRTLTRARSVWIGNRIIGIKKHGIKRFGRFLPSGAPRPLYPLRIPLERIGFVVTLISLSVRLFANRISGHVLLKVIVGFAWDRMKGGFVIYRRHFIPILVLRGLFVLERGVGFVQAYVFVLLTCIYRGDIVKGGH